MERCHLGNIVLLLWMDQHGFSRTQHAHPCCIITCAHSRRGHTVRHINTHTRRRAERNNAQQHTGWGFNGAVTMGREVRGLFGCFSYWSAAAWLLLLLLLFTERSYFITTRPSNLVCTVHNLTGLIRSKEEQGTNIERVEVQVRIIDLHMFRCWLRLLRYCLCSVSRVSWLDVT